ncbi:hypothetical protein NQ318_013472 [Aromia moschata]|uniref:Uncharacterized protein n=1 Tax=Aromia moschata TaxID=1265417 RepID=A0AAV8YBI7_9CUCU|nr:hypothetical protein NQ318_013472 [Aromia moschata]
MTTGMPELGSKISLISKADIRYEGRLFTVDPQECTIALASVRSFGTEERDTQYPVPAQNQVYDYILFRGSDIKDIRVVNNVTHPQPLNDPAIMQLSVPPSLGGQPFQSHPVLGPMGPQIGQFAGAYGSIGTMGGMAPGMGPGLGIQRDSRGLGNKPSELIIPGQEPPPSVLSPTVEPPRSSNDHASVLDLIGGSRSTTPASLSSRKSPTIDQGVQAGGSKRDDKKVVKPIQPPGQRNQQRKSSRERRDSRGDGQSMSSSSKQIWRQQKPTRQSVWLSESSKPTYSGLSRLPKQSVQSEGQLGQQRSYATQGRPRGGFRTNQNQQNQSTNKVKNTLKFENDYDFEQANTEFEELRSQLSKVKLDEAGSTSTKSEINGDVDKKDDSGNETGAGETEQEEEHEVYYDKSKSFFDKISCEAVERAKGKSQRTDWRVERKLNSETFGVAATRRGNYRGRGSYRGSGYRGGYRSGYRQPQRRDQQQSNRSEPNQRQVAQNSSNNAAKQASSPTQSTTAKPTTQTTQSASRTPKAPEPLMTEEGDECSEIQVKNVTELADTGRWSEIFVELDGELLF